MSGFLSNIKDWLVHAVFGQFQLDVWRAEDKKRAECERVAKKHYEFVAEVQKHLNTDHPDCPPIFRS